MPALLACLFLALSVRLETALVADAIPAPAASGPADSVGMIDESAFGFRLRVPEDWSIDIDAEDGPMLSWRMHQTDWIAGKVPDSLLALSVTVIEPDSGKDTEAEFRSFVDSYVRHYLAVGQITSFEPLMFGGYAGFTAEARGRIKSGPGIDVSARIFFYETRDRQVIVSAVAPRSQTDALGRLGEAGSLIEAASPPADHEGDLPGTAAGDTATSSGAAVRLTILPDSGGLLEPFSWGGGSLADFGGSNENGLSIEIPSDARTGGVGVHSVVSPVRLGDLERGDATILRARFDPQRTDTALIVLCPGRMVPCLSEPSFHIRFLPREDEIELSIWSEDLEVAAERLPATPEILAVRIDRDGVYVYPSNGDALTAVRSRALAPHAALELVVAAIPIEGGGRLALRSLSVEKLDAAPGQALPEPRTSVFPSSESDRWQKLATAGGDFDAFATLDAGGLSVSVPDNRSWGMTGLVSRDPLMAIADGSVSTIPHRLRGEVAPSASEAFAVALLPAADVDPWLGSRVYADFVRLPDDRYRVRLYACGSAARVAEMTVAAKWSGAFDLLLHPGRAEIALERSRVSTPLLACLLPDTGVHVALFAAAPEEHRHASLRLLRLAVDRAGNAPDPDDAATSPDADFDPRSWLSGMAAELSAADH